MVCEILIAGLVALYKTAMLFGKLSEMCTRTRNYRMSKKEPKEIIEI